MKKLTFLILVLSVLLLTTISADALPLWGSDASGELDSSRTTGGGGISTYSGSPWDSGNFTIDWLIVDNQNGTWTYKYDITILTDDQQQLKNLSHWILEVTQYDEPIETDPDTLEQKFWTESGGVDLLSGGFYGVKFDLGTTNGVASYTLTTDRAPVYGVFWAKDGDWGPPGDKKDLLAYSTALLDSDFRTSESLTTTDFIVRPDGSGAVVPEPSTVLLLGIGLLGIVGLGRRKLKK